MILNFKELDYQNIVSQVLNSFIDDKHHHEIRYHTYKQGAVGI